MTQHTVNRMIPKSSVMELEEPVCDLSNLAELAFDYILPLLNESLTGKLTEARVDSASYVLTQLANKAGTVKALSYSIMEQPNMPIRATDFTDAVKALSEELRIDWSLSTIAEDAGSDEQIETRQRDRVHTALANLEALVAHH